MATITDSQKSFLEHHGVPLTDVLDAEGMQKKKYSKIMKDLGMKVAIGVSACGNCGETMRFRQGHCVRCQPQGFGFRKRWHSLQDVYVARGDYDTELLKIGIAEDAGSRMLSLEHWGYAECYHWELLFRKICRNAGQVEHRVNHILAQLMVDKNEFNDARMSASTEMFRCTEEIATQAIYQADKEVNG